MEKKGRKWINFSITILCATFAWAFTNISETDETVNLQTALSNGQLQAEIISNGGYSQNSVHLDLVNKTSRILKVVVPAGSLFKTDDNSEQELVVPRDQLIVLNPKAQLKQDLSAYCTEASDLVPQKGNKFTLTHVKEKNLSSLINYLNKNNVSTTSIQEAIWSVTDKHPISHVSVTNSADKELRNFLCQLTGMKDTWYSSPQERIVTADRRIIQETVTIKGDLKFQCKVGAVVDQEIHKKDSGLLFKSDKRNTVKTGNVDFSFTLQVKGWEKGEYEVLVKEGESILGRYPFSI